MSFEDVWALPEGPLDVARLDEALAELASWLQIETGKVKRTGAIDVKLRVARGRILDVLRLLDPQSFVFELSGERLTQELEPPWDAAATHYRLTFTLYQGDGETAPSLVLYSNESDNRKIWAVAHALFRKLAQRMGAEPVEEALGWDADAILKPRN